jgi:crotonobetainyl-CoA:carnitine CoA-transferase CaiB-like acyl-CoA transferase
MKHWVDLLGAAIPVGPVYDIDQALESPFVKSIGMIGNVPHPLVPDMRLLANPLKIDGERPEQKTCAPLGANNEELLQRAETAD